MYRASYEMKLVGFWMEWNELVKVKVISEMSRGIGVKYDYVYVCIVLRLSGAVYVCFSIDLWLLEVHSIANITYGTVLDCLYRTV